jgi:ATP-dependent exoDNAse (exonuclease V) alpha subunit
VDELEQVGFSQARTIQRLLVDPREHANLRDRVLIVDEAGMVSARQMTALLELAEQQAARVVFSGDNRRLQSVEAGDTLRILERESRLRSVSLTQVQRGTSAAYGRLKPCGSIPRAGSRNSNRWARSGGGVAVGGRGVAGGARPP